MHQVTKRLFILFLIFNCFTTQIEAKDLPFGEKYFQFLKEKFTQNGEVSPSKIEEFEIQITTKRNQHFKHLYNYYFLEKGHSPKKAKKKASEKKELLVYDYIASQCDELKKTKYGPSFFLLADRLIHLEDSLRTDSTDPPDGLAIFKTLSVRASNNHATNLFQKNLNSYWDKKSIEKKRTDVSQLNPKDDGKFWIDTDIENYKIDKTYNSNSPLFKGVDIKFPEDYVILDEVRKTQRVPKLDVFIRTKKKKKKVELKLKFAHEVHSEPTSAALFAALGFNTDPSKYYERLKVYMGENTERDFRREFESYFRGNNLDRHIVEWGEDERGKYFIMRECLIEAKPKENLRVGPWSWGLKGMSDLREVRALNILNVWIGNKDVKEASNNKLIIKSKDYSKLFYVNHDLGWGYGRSYIESADTFPWKAVKSYDSNKAKLNMYLLYKNSAFKDVNFDDAKWITRRIARLSKKQIHDAFVVGGWPEGARILLVEKMANRRNQLVEAFGLSKEYRALKVNKKITTPSGSIVDGKIDKERLKNRGTDVVGELDRAIEDALIGLEKIILREGFNVGSDLVSGIRVGLPDILGAPFTGNVIFRMQRNISDNKEPIDKNDRLLVSDTIRIGFELRVGQGIRGKLRLFREYNLIYGVPYSKRAHIKPDYILSLLQTPTHKISKLPPRYTLVVEDYIDGSGAIELASGQVVDIRPKLSLSRIKLNRLLISDKGTGIVKVLKDRSIYTKLALELRLYLAQFISIKFFEASFKKGQFERNYWEIDTHKKTYSPESKYNLGPEFPNMLLAKLRRNADVTVLKDFKNHSHTLSTFTKSKSEFNFLNVLYNSTESIYQNIEETQKSAPSETDQRLQFEIIDTAGFKTLYQKEERSAHTFYTALRSENNDFIEPVLGINILIEDTDTRSNELAYILKSFNLGANDYTFMPIKPELHSRDQAWGRVYAYFDFLIYDEGINQLLSLTKKELYQSFYDVTGKNKRQWEWIRRDSRPEEEILDDFEIVVRHIMRAQREPNKDKKIRYLVKSLNRAFINSSGRVKMEAIASLNNLIDEDNKFIGSRLTSSDYEEVVFPSGKPMVNQIGKLRHSDARLRIFDLGNPNNIYNLFDTFYEKGLLAPSLEKD